MRVSILFLMIGLWLPNLVAQVSLQTEEQVSGFFSLPQEKIFVHSNATFFLTGEYLYYKVYCFEAKRAELTALSKVAYVELLGNDGESIFRQKVLLKNGMGQGDFFIPTNISSGGYKLVAYTKWMHNQDQDSFYKGDIFIVNPYQSNQVELQKNADMRADSLARAAIDTMPKSFATKKTASITGPVELVMTDTSFGKRAKVSIRLKAKYEKALVHGDYSISVRKSSEVNKPFEESIARVVEKRDISKMGNVSKVSDIVLPELRGELFQGKVVALQGDSTVKNLKVAISIPGEYHILEVALTDELGNFQFNIAESYSGDKLFVQVLAEDREAYDVEINEPYTADHTKLDFKEISLDFSMREEILQRSIHNQIENSYFQFRPDSVLTISAEQFFEDKAKKTYLLDDYTRFRTVRETLVEIIQDVSSKRIARDNYVIRVKGYDYASVADIAPLILLDGCFIQDHNTLLDFDARAIEEIEVFRHKFIYGADIYEGGMLLTTKNGNGYENFLNNGAISIVDILEPQPNKKYFIQQYNGQSNSISDFRLPDDRLQLLWMPMLDIDEKESEISFFTSDVSGEFEIHLEGITKDNKPVSIRKYFTVE